MTEFLYFKSIYAAALGFGKFMTRGLRLICLFLAFEDCRLCIIIIEQLKKSWRFTAAVRYAAAPNIGCGSKRKPRSDHLEVSFSCVINVQQLFVA